MVNFYRILQFETTMTHFLELIFALSVILFSAKFAGYISSRLGQPSVLGELIVGLILGPSLIDLTHLPFIQDTHLLDEVIAEIGELGVLLLMFLAGLELHLNDLAKNTRVSAYAGTLGVLVPVGLGWGLGRLVGLEPSPAFFLGLTLGATSVSISAQTLMELKVLRSRVGLGLLGAAVFDDILVILFLSTFVALVNGGNGLLEIVIVLGRMILFLGLSAGFGVFILPTLTKVIGKLEISQGSLTFAIIILLIYGLAAELVGNMAAITGTFLAGLMFGRTQGKTPIQRGIQTLAFSFFVPVFFISIGLKIDWHSFTLNDFWVLLAVTAVAIIGKIFGAGLGAKLAKFSWRESTQIGLGMVSRGEVGLIVAAVGIDENLISAQYLPAIVGMILISTLVTPPLLRAAFGGRKGLGSDVHQEVKND